MASSTRGVSAIVGMVAVLLTSGNCTAQVPGSPPDGTTFTMMGPPPGERPLVLTTEFHLQDIDAIDDETETVRFAGSLIIRWRDPRQAFQPALEGVNEKFLSDPYQYNELYPTWVPQVDLLNAYGQLETRSQLLRIAADGTCTLLRAINGMAKVRLELRRYPYDQQQLPLIFHAHGHPSNEVVFAAGPQAMTWDSTSLRIPQWNVQRFDASVAEHGTRVMGAPLGSSTFNITLRVSLAPLHMMRLVMLPLALIVILSWSVFWMDRSSVGDRMSVSFVGILTAVTYQVIIADTLPDISYMTFIHGFVNLSFLLMCMTILVNLMVHISDRNDRSALGDRIDHTCRYAFPVAYAFLLGINWAYFQ